MTCKWLITMVIVSPVRIGLFPWPFHGIKNGGDPNHVSKSWDDHSSRYPGKIMRQETAMFDGVWYVSGNKSHDILSVTGSLHKNWVDGGNTVVNIR